MTRQLFSLQRIMSFMTAPST